MSKEAKLINNDIIILVNETEKPNNESDKYRAEPHHDGFSRHDWNLKKMAFTN